MDILKYSVIAVYNIFESIYPGLDSNSILLNCTEFELIKFRIFIKVYYMLICQR